MFRTPDAATSWDRARSSFTNADSFRNERQRQIRYRRPEWRVLALCFGLKNRDDISA
ncbi:hypothetical protein J6590_021313 [Homalodisca vitripennis]|nr:hypothetical protein J6590_021313 [Homalodisca vitripennis]